jgi:hypothetical protein
VIKLLQTSKRPLRIFQTLRTQICRRRKLAPVHLQRVRRLQVGQNLGDGLVDVAAAPACDATAIRQVRI